MAKEQIDRLEVTLLLGSDASSGMLEIKLINEHGVVQSSDLSTIGLISATTPLHTIVYWQIIGSKLDQYQVASCTGIFSFEEFSVYGFPLPGRRADAIYLVDDQQNDPTQWEWWLEGETVLGIKQMCDSVMLCDHFAWYRIPVEDIVHRIKNEEFSRVERPDMQNGEKK